MTTLVQTSFNLSGMHCASCKTLIEKKVKKIAGVQQAAVDLPANSIDIIADHQISAAELESGLQGTPYHIM